jgi:hypothetical protein
MIGMEFETIAQRFFGKEFLLCDCALMTWGSVVLVVGKTTQFA